jgi:hypothetical protein
MNLGRYKYYKCIFFAAMVYDIVLGIIFTFSFKQAFSWIGIAHKLPQYDAYISLIGAFLFVIGIAYLLIFLGDLRRNLDLIIVGALYKFAYSAVGIYYFIVGEIPHIIFLALFGVIDVIFLILMVECAIYLRKIPVSKTE